MVQWEDNFRALKLKGRDVEKLPSVIKIDCITVSTSPTKTAIDDMMQRLFDTLLSSLRKVKCGDVLCCAVLCCAVLSSAVLCCAVLCCAVLCCAVLCCAVLG